ncbi:MAG: hypothetical protein Q4G09_05120 [Clostridia bacterium]|nr:hypothetical protein [Clostridia bacterium]
MEINDILVISLSILIIVISVLGFIYWMLSRKEKANKNNKTEKAEKTEKKENSSTTTVAKQYTKMSIFDFMEFDTIEDNMIVQMDGKKYLMIIECEGINYDLMSEIEKNSVEQGFIQFLNTLRHSIQLYVQTRTINIESSIENYNNKIRQIKYELEKKQNEYNKMLQFGSYDKEDLNKIRLEVARIQNMYDYGADVVKNIEKMSLNKNVLRKHYYIIIPYYTAELGNDLLGKEEQRNMVFSELYTRAQTIIRTLSACSMKGRVMDSDAIAELLYVAYNRDEAEIFGIDKALKAGYDELYSTAPDVLDKRMKAINTTIEQKAIEMAREVINEARTDKEKMIAKKENNFDELVAKMAKLIINQNEEYIGKDIAKEAIKKVSKKNTKEEVVKNEKKQKTTTRRVTK